MVKRRKIRPASALESLSPLWLSSRIILLQIIFYAVAASLLLFTTLLQGSSFSLDLLFSWRPLRADNASGWTLALLWVCNSFTNVVTITLLVSRTKYVLDFTLTAYSVHLLVCVLYTRSLPASWLWWTVQICSTLITVSLSTWLCQKREMQPISWGGGRKFRGDPSGSSVVREHEMMPLKNDQDIV